MMSMNSVIDSTIANYYQDDISDVSRWCDNEYQGKFASTFDAVRTIHRELKIRQISDADLQWIIIDLPMELINISEKLNDLKLSLEVIKIKKKALIREAKCSNTSFDSHEHDLVISAYNMLISRVETQMSFSRELIMGAKKVWDSRRKTESVNPISEIDSLPEYIPPAPVSKTYIK